MNQNLIALFVPSLRSGGAEHVTINMAVGLQNRGFNVDLVLVKAEGPFLSNIPSGVRVTDLRSSRALVSLPGLIHYLRKERPMGLLSALGHVNIVAIWAKVLACVDTKIIVTVNSTLSVGLSNSLFSKGRLLRLFTKMFYSRADAVVACSRGVADDIFLATGFKRDSIKVIYNPAITNDLLEKAKEPLDHPWFLPEAPPVVIALGRLNKVKDFPVLIKAFKKIRKNRSVRLMIIGKGGEKASLESLVRELGLEEDVSIPGFLDNPYKYIAKSAVYVLSSISEGLPTALIEALALGLPVVSTDCPNGPREILRDGQLGRLVPVHNSEMLADAIIATLDEPRKIISPEDLRPFTLDYAIDAYLRLLAGGNQQNA
jgi:glycosyltransferase involved in cell wall biosynthesis